MSRRGDKMPWTAGRVKQLRGRYGDTQAEFARRIPGLSVDAIQNWEYGRPISPLGEFALNTLEAELNEYEELRRSVNNLPKKELAGA